jgi:WD repeat-containing protein 19
MEQQKMAVA